MGLDVTETTISTTSFGLALVMVYSISSSFYKTYKRKLVASRPHIVYTAFGFPALLESLRLQIHNVIS